MWALQYIREKGGHAGYYTLMSHEWQLSISVCCGGECMHTSPGPLVIQSARYTVAKAMLCIATCSHMCHGMTARDKNSSVRQTSWLGRTDGAASRTGWQDDRWRVTVAAVRWLRWLWWRVRHPKDKGVRASPAHCCAPAHPVGPPPKHTIRA